ncbi:MAG: ferritin-like domain-containing protein [Planctomycetes bacterium]|nr:ferritin-like domain-containing protein [Planctomycetota bacterium]
MHPWPTALLAVIAAPDAAAKDALLAALPAPPDGDGWDAPVLPPRPGRPPGWREGPPPGRKGRTLAHGPTRLRFLLALHHIELSAIDLACAAAALGAGMPAAFHADQVRVAREEALHAGLVAGLLEARGLPPGSEPVHHRLWDAARACADLGALLVVVPRVLEARGLDANATVLPRLRELDPPAAAVLERIYADEIGHVATGTRWQRQWCAARGLDPEAHFAATARAHFGAGLRGPFALDRPGRLAAGFSAGELAVMEEPAALT